MSTVSASREGQEGIETGKQGIEASKGKEKDNSSKEQENKVDRETGHVHQQPHLAGEEILDDQDMSDSGPIREI
jgi:hypothetical protein